MFLTLTIGFTEEVMKWIQIYVLLLVNFAQISGYDLHMGAYRILDPTWVYLACAEATQEITLQQCT